MDLIRNVKPLLPLNLQLFAEPAPGGEGGNGGEGGAGGTGGNPGGDDPSKGGAGGEGGTGGEGNKGSDPKALEAQIEQLKAEMAKQKAALDAATSEAGKYKKELRQKQTQEEIDAANKKEAEEKAAARLAELEKEVARTKSSKTVMAKLGVDEDTAGKIAECLIGCEDVDNALLLIQKVWEAREKALRIEFGKIPGPGAGGKGGEDEAEQAAIELGKRLGRERAESNKSVTDGLKGYIR